MTTRPQFNIITGELPNYQIERRFRSMQQLKKMDKSEGMALQKIKLPSLGTPKDKNAFKYSYMNKI